VIRLGIDVGGTGIKGAVVDLASGELVTQRHRVPTPQPATPVAVAETVALVVEKIMAESPCEGRFGCALPGVVTGGIVRTAANIDPTWVGTDGCRLITDAVDRDVVLLNDADAAGLAEMRFGAGRASGTVVLLTLGTGIGSAVFVDGDLLPNTELGHLQMWGDSAEERASAKAREDENLDWEEWATDWVNPYLNYVENLLWPDLIVLGGGITKKPERFMPYLETRAEIVPAELRNNAGIVCAALAAHLWR
jgi:polyphosphate glucokinase